MDIKQIDIKNTLWECQKKALEEIQKWIREPGDNLNFLVCMPTGTGKTAVIAISSAFFVRGNVLIITPWDNLRTQMEYDLNEKTWNDIRIEKPRNLAIQTFSGKDLERKISSPSDLKTIFITTFQGLIKVKQNKEVFERLKSIIDIVMVDEGHYEPALWWGEAVNDLKKNIILFTATPYRNDLKFFRIKEKAFYHYKYSTAIEEEIIRSVEVKKLEIGEDYSINSISKAISSIWSIENKKKYANPVPRMIVCCEDFKGVKDLTISLRQNGLKAIGIHYRATPKNIPDNYQYCFRKSVPDTPEEINSIDAEIWVHERILTEGLDFPPFCVLVMTWKISNDRRLIQQIGRIIRSANNDKNNKAIVYEIAGSNISRSWNFFMEFEKNFRVVTPKYYRTFLKKYLGQLPKYEYFGKRFRNRLEPEKLLPELARKEILSFPSVVVRKIKDNIEYDNFIRDITDEIQLEDFITIGPRDDYPVIEPKDTQPYDCFLWVYNRFSNSKTLLSATTYEIKISSLCIVIIKPYLFITDTESFLPFKSLEKYSIGLDISEIKRAFSKGYQPIQVQLVNSLPHQSVIRSTSRTGPNLLYSPNSLTESKYICRSIKGSHNSQGSRYISFNTSRISDNVPKFKRNEMCLDDLIGWCTSLQKEFTHDREHHPYLRRFANQVEAPELAIPKYGFMDFWSGDFSLVDINEEILTPTNAVFEFEKEDDEETHRYKFIVSGRNHRNKILKAELSATWNNNDFHFKTLRSDGLVIKEAKTISGNQIIDYKLTEISTFCGRKNGDFFISLEKSNLIYNNGAFYEIDISSHFSDLSDYFVPLADLDEPNLPEVVKSSERKQGHFSKKSLFNIIRDKKTYQKLFEGDPDLIICDHSSDEIADFLFVQFNLPKAVVIHCKAKQRLNQNTEYWAIAELQEVISQASKNLVFLSGRSQDPRHLSEWTKDGLVKGYKEKRICKKPKDLPYGAELWEKIKSDVLLHRNSTKELWIVMGGAIRKREIVSEIEKCKSSNSNLACLFHMIDGLGASCIEANVKLRIFVNS